MVLSGRTLSSSPSSSFLNPSSLPANPQPKRLCLNHFHGITHERHFDRPVVVVDGAGGSVWAHRALSWPPGAFQRLSLHICRRGRIRFFLQVNVKARSVFRKCFKTPGNTKMLKYPLSFHPCNQALAPAHDGDERTATQGGNSGKFCPGLLS